MSTLEKAVPEVNIYLASYDIVWVEIACIQLLSCILSNRNIKISKWEFILYLSTTVSTGCSLPYFERVQCRLCYVYIEKVYS